MEIVTLYYFIGSASSNELLKTASEHFSGISDIKVHRESGKKPYFENYPNLHFSVSHSGEIWICVFAQNEIGCDIQLHRENSRFLKLSERWFHPNEASKVMCESDFYDIWARKEAFVKALGCGIDEKFKKFDTSSGVFELNGITLGLYDFKLPHSISQNYSATVAYSCDVSIKFVCMNTIT